MVSTLKFLVVDNSTDPPLYYKELVGLSTDEKPTSGIANGSSFLEMDTSNVYLFDQDSKEWVIL